MKRTSPLANLLLVIALGACGAPPGTSDEPGLSASSVQDASTALAVQNCTPLTATSVIANGDDGSNGPANTLDDKLDTRWSNLGKGAWIDYDLGSTRLVQGVAIAWHDGTRRTSAFTVSSSLDGINYTPVYSGTSSGTTTAAETYAFTPLTTRRVRITVQGNSLNEWASIAEARPCAGPSAEPSGVVWRADFETGSRSQWDRAQLVSEDRLAVVTNPARQGTYALKATVKQGDDPINASGNRNELVKMTNEAAGSEYYYRWSTMFATDFPSAKTWQLFTQWHHNGSEGSPPVEFYVYGEEVRLNIGGSPGVIVWKTPLVRGKWHDFVFHVKWSASASEGFVELYYDGQLVLPKRNIATQFSGQVNYLKVGLYRSDTVAPTGVVYHDNWLMARSLQDVL